MAALLFDPHVAPPAQAGAHGSAARSLRAGLGSAIAREARNSGKMGPGLRRDDGFKSDLFTPLSGMTYSWARRIIWTSRSHWRSSPTTSDRGAISVPCVLKS